MGNQLGQSPSTQKEKIVKGLFLLTTKPVLYVANMWMKTRWQTQMPSTMCGANPSICEATENAEVVVISARVEEEIAELDDEDKAEFFGGYRLDRIRCG